MYKKIQTIFTTIIVLFPFLHQYKSYINGVTLAELLTILCFPFLIYYFRLNKSKIWIPFIYIILFIFYVLSYQIFSSYLVNSFNFVNSFVGTARFTYYFILIFFGLNSLFNFSKAVKLYKLFSLIFTIYLFTQVLMHMMFNVVLPWTMPFLQVYQSDYNNINFAGFFADFYRPYSLFLEPGYYAQYVLPLLVITLFFKKAKNISFAVFLTTGLIFSTSGQGILLGGLVWICYLIYNYRKNILLMLSGIILLGMLSSQLIKIDFFSRSLARLFSGENASSQSRIIGPLQIFNSLEFKNKFLGIGFNNVSAFIGDQYLNSLGYILVTTGIFGMFLISLFLFSNFLKLNVVSSRVLLLVYFVLFFVTGIFTSGNTVFYLTIIYSMYINERDYKNEEWT